MEAKATWKSASAFLDTLGVCLSALPPVVERREVVEVDMGAGDTGRDVARL